GLGAGAGRLTAQTASARVTPASPHGATRNGRCRGYSPQRRNASPTSLSGTRAQNTLSRLRKADQIFSQSSEKSQGLLKIFSGVQGIFASTSHQGGQAAALQQSLSYPITTLGTRPRGPDGLPNPCQEGVPMAITHEETRRAQLKRVAEAYFEGMGKKD